MGLSCHGTEINIILITTALKCVSKQIAPYSKSLPNQPININDCTFPSYFSIENQKHLEWQVHVFINIISKGQLPSVSGIIQGVGRGCANSVSKKKSFPRSACTSHFRSYSIKLSRLLNIFEVLSEEMGILMFSKYLRLHETELLSLKRILLVLHNLLYFFKVGRFLFHNWSLPLCLLVRIRVVLWFANGICEVCRCRGHRIRLSLKKLYKML